MKDLHSGSGTLRGGGVRRVYGGNKPTFKEYKRKMDYRLGFVTIFSLATIMIILFIYGLFHSKGNDALTEYVNDTKHFIQYEEPLLSTSSPRGSEEKDDKKREIPLHELSPHDSPPEVEEDNVHVKVESSEKDSIRENNEKEPVLLLLPTSTATPVQIEEITTQTEPTTTEESTSTSTTTTTTTTSTTTTTTTTPINIIIDSNRLTIGELEAIYSRLHSTYMTMWNLAGLNLIALLILVPLTYLFCSGYFKTSIYKIIYRVVLILVLIFLIVQLIYLIDPLLTSAATFPSTIDRLFVEAYPREKAYLRKIEDRYACSFETHEVLVLRGIQDACVPKIKDSVLPTYTVVLLIIIDLLPFAFAIFTYAWGAWIKDSNFVQKTRLRIEENNQRRPQTREQILNRTLAQEYESTKNTEAHNLA